MIILDMADKRPIYEQIIDKYTQLICRGVLKPNEQLPSVRSLAIELSINPNTIQRAYGDMEREGYIYSIKGKGNFVADIKSRMPQMQNDYYEKLDELLGRMNDYGITKDEIINHIKCRE